MDKASARLLRLTQERYVRSVRSARGGCSSASSKEKAAGRHSWSAVLCCADIETATSSAAIVTMPYDTEILFTGVVHFSQCR